MEAIIVKNIPFCFARSSSSMKLSFEMPYSLWTKDHLLLRNIYLISLFLSHKRMLHVCMLSCFSCVQLFVTLWTIVCQAPLSMGFSRQEYWSGLPRPPPGDIPNPGIEPMSLMSPVLAGEFFTTRSTWEAPCKNVTS